MARHKKPAGKQEHKKIRKEQKDAKKSALETLRHSCSHVLADAVKQLFPEVKLGIGPAIEEGFYYDFEKKEPFTPEALAKIENKMQDIINQNHKFKKFSKTKLEAKKLLSSEPYKIDLLKEIDSPTFYQHANFIDLCAGPHVESTGEIKAFKLLKIAGAYWKGDSKNPQLQRIYGTAFPSKEELDSYLKNLEEAEKRNHVKIGKQLDWFSMHPEGPGFVFWHPKGMIVYNELLRYWTEEHEKAGYHQIKTPILLSKELWEKSGHWEHYKENMYFTNIDNREFALKPMNCPGGILIYKERLHSYREFPLRIAELGLVHRHELSGVLNGLFRVRAFTQDDAHIYCTEAQVEAEVTGIIQLCQKVYKKFGFEFHIELSTMPKNHIGLEETWKKAEAYLENALNKNNLNFKLNPGEGAFYGPKIDFHIKDSLGRAWQCATIQLDFQMPEKFNLTYDGEDGQKHKPVMIHRTILGSIERFIGILIEHFAGELPLWLSPVQAVLLTITDRNIKHAQEICDKMKSQNIRIQLDSRTETMPRKVREAQLQKIPYIITIGDKEVQNNTLAVRTLDGKVLFGVNSEKFIQETRQKIIERK